MDPSCYGVCKDGRVKQNDFSYIEKWYNSVKKLGLKAFIFYDNLNEDFVKKYTTNKIKFIEVEDSKYSNNDWRFFCYARFLKENPCDIVFMSDSSDVVVVKDPAELIEEHEDYRYFACEDIIYLSEYQWGLATFLKILESAGWAGKDFFVENMKSMKLINMGVIGGRYQDILDFVNLFEAMRLRYPEESFNMNMSLGNFIFRYALDKRPILLGDPVTSAYKQFQDSREDVYFIHK